MKCTVVLSCLLWLCAVCKVMKLSKVVAARNTIVSTTRTVSITNDYFFETTDEVIYDIDCCCNSDNGKRVIEYCIYNEQRNVHMFGFLITSADIAIRGSAIESKENGTCVTSTIDDIEDANNAIKRVAVNYKYYITNNILHGVSLDNQQLNVMNFMYLNSNTTGSALLKTIFAFDEALNVTVQDLLAINAKYNHHWNVTLGNKRALVYSCTHAHSGSIISVQMLFPMILSQDVLMSNTNNNKLDGKLLFAQLLFISIFLIIMLCYAVTKENLNSYSITPDSQMLKELIYQSNHNNNKDNHII